MTSTRLTLGQILLDADQASAPDAGAVPGTPDRGVALRLPDLPELGLPGVERELWTKVAEALDVDLGDILVSAWNRYRMLRQYRDPERYPAGQSVLVPLAEHDLRSIHRPSVEVMAGETPLLRLTFEVELALRLEGVVLKVQDGRIREVCAGAGVGSGSLGLEGATLVNRKTPRFDLPGRIDLGAGVPIPA